MVRKAVIALLFAAIAAAADDMKVVPPGEPDVPAVDFSDRNVFYRKAEAVIAGGGKLEGSLMFGSSSFSILCGGGWREPSAVDARRIRSFRIVLWEPKRYGKDRYMMRPREMEIRIGDGESVRCAVPREFYRLEFMVGAKSKKLYTFFYDVWERGRWARSGKEDFSYPAEHPLAGTVTEVLFP